MTDVKATTGIYGIFGHPVRHSLSPAMHNSAFETLGLDCVYVAFDIHPEKIGLAAEAIKTLDIMGVNVTIPHKETIMPYLDDIAPDAVHTGAVNTVKNDGGKLYGYNTDVEGFMRAVKEDLGFEPEGADVFLLGAGGAARAVMSAFCMNAAGRICIANRTPGKAESLATQFRNHFSEIEIESMALDDAPAVRSRLAEADIIVNSTSAGMSGEGAVELPLEALKKNAVIYDLVYKPPETALVKESRERGHKASGGLSMLLYQGAKSFEIWTGKEAPVDVMKKALV